MRIERERAESDRVIAAAMPHLAPSIAVVGALLDRHPERAGSVADLAPCLEYARAVVERGVPAHEGPLPQRETWPTDEDIALDQAHARHRAGVAARLELCLCVFGTFVALHARDHAAPPELADAIARERVRHLAHREEERAERIAALERELARARRALEVPSPHAGARAYLESVEAKLSRVRALDPETLSTDRCALD